MKKRAIITAAIAVVCAFIIGFIVYSFVPKYTTLEEREEKLNEIKSGFIIDNEIEVDRHIISAAYSGNKVCLAVFRPEGKGYELVSNAYRDIDDIIILSVSINGIPYDFCWFNGTNIQKARVIYTDENGEKSSSIYDVENNRIVTSKSPDGNYTIEVFYTDVDGNRYE